MRVLVKKVRDVADPTYANVGDSGFDLRNANGFAVYLEPGEQGIIPTGLAFSIPEGFEIQVRPRSGLAAKDSLMVTNSPGTIDAGYRGEVCVILYNAGNRTIILMPGDRIAQAVVAPVVRAEFEVVSELDDTERGEGKFGSTGMN